jgi:hypothetical protein
MKAVLEFNYPDDERKLLYALKGQDMYVALADIRMQITEEFRHNADPVAVLMRVRNITDDIFRELGDS